MKKSLVLVLAMLMILSVALSACGPKPATEPNAPVANAEPKVLNINFAGGEPTWLDAQKSTSSADGDIIHAYMEGLMRVQNEELIPGIAESYEVSADGLTYTFHLRDAKWADGKAITAKDFEYGWKRALDPKTASEYAYIIFYIKGAEEFNAGKGSIDDVAVKATDDKTLVCTLKAPAAYFPYLTDFSTYYPCRQDIVEKFGDKYAAEAANTMGNGPFVVTKWEHETGLTFEKNANYWNKDAVKLDKVEMTLVTDSNTELNMYLAGDIDMTTAMTAEQIKQVPAEEVKSYNSGAVWYLAFNQKDKAGIMKNVNIRKALTYAIDRQTLISAVLQQQGTLPAMAVVQPEIVPGLNGKTFREEAGDLFKDNDVEGAKAALAAGLKELGLKELPTLKLLMNDDDNGRRLGQGLQEMIKKSIGVNIELEPVPAGQRIERLHAKDYQIALAGWGPDYPDPYSDLDLFKTNAGNNDFYFSNAEYDKLIDTAAVEPDVAKRNEMLHQAEKILMDEMVVGPMYFRYRTYALKPYVQNMWRHAINGEIGFPFADIVDKPKK